LEIVIWNLKRFGNIKDYPFLKLIDEGIGDEDGEVMGWAV
jgi:hypothetical protein